MEAIIKTAFSFLVPYSCEYYEISHSNMHENWFRKLKIQMTLKSIFCSRLDISIFFFQQIEHLAKITQFGYFWTFRWYQLWLFLHNIDPKSFRTMAQVDETPDSDDSAEY